MLPDGRNVDYTYASTGELLTTVGADTYPIAYTYDDLGRMKTLSTYKNYPNMPEITTWNYDPIRGFMTSKIYPDGKGTSYTYNPDGQILSRTWARGISTVYTYDNAGTLLSIDYSDATPDITYVRDNLGRSTSITDAAGTHILTYNNDSTLANIMLPHISNHSIQYSYDTLGRQTDNHAVT